MAQAATLNLEPLISLSSNRFLRFLTPVTCFNSLNYASVLFSPFHFPLLFSYLVSFPFLSSLLTCFSSPVYLVYSLHIPCISLASPHLSVSRNQQGAQKFCWPLTVIHFFSVCACVSSHESLNLCQIRHCLNPKRLQLNNNVSKVPSKFLTFCEQKCDNLVSTTRAKLVTQVISFAATCGASLRIIGALAQVADLSHAGADYRHHFTTSSGLQPQIVGATGDQSVMPFGAVFPRGAVSTESSGSVRNMWLSDPCYGGIGWCSDDGF